MRSVVITRELNIRSAVPPTSVTQVPNLGFAPSPLSCTESSPLTKESWHWRCLDLYIGVVLNSNNTSTVNVCRHRGHRRTHCTGGESLSDFDAWTKTLACSSCGHAGAKNRDRSLRYTYQMLLGQVELVAAAAPCRPPLDLCYFLWPRTLAEWRSPESQRDSYSARTCSELASGAFAFTGGGTTTKAVFAAGQKSTRGKRGAAKGCCWVSQKENKEVSWLPRGGCRALGRGRSRGWLCTCCWCLGRPWPRDGRYSCLHTLRGIHGWDRGRRRRRR